jgi:hypothetical protein
LAVSKPRAQNCDGERFNFENLIELEVRKQYQTEITDRFAALGNLCDDEDRNRAWENIRESIKTTAKESLVIYELKKHKVLFDEECLQFHIKQTG